MNIKRYNISKPKKYTAKDGQEKTQWNNIGTITEFVKDDGTTSRIMEIPAIGLEANIFPFEKVEQKQNQAPEIAPIAVDDDPINPDDIPF